MTKPNIQSIVNNVLIEDTNSVWRLKSHDTFAYSDGAASEKYLCKVFSKVTDLSTRSPELAAYIKDWPSEYHLSTKRSQLLSGFSFDRSLRVLEVGCGCGAITRYLGENFDQVVSIEGNLHRARIAGLRCRDLDTVSIICAPFHEIQFTEKFDIIFCIGVFEYSASFIEADDPYDAALQYFSGMLTDDGMTVIAIENQFGLKYFCSAREDHLGTMFEGLEGYHRNPNKVRTFGKRALENQLQKYFRNVAFYYPYPDYKIPDCVISPQFLLSSQAGELISQMRSRDYSGLTRPLWDESATILELANNGMLDFFSNSFLIFAGIKDIRGVTFDQQAIMYSSGRKPAYSTCTRVLREPDGATLAVKCNLQDHAKFDHAPIKLIYTESTWIDSISLLTQTMLRSHERNANLTELFTPAIKWVDFLEHESFKSDNIRWLDGKHFDSIWGNAYLIDNECKLIDREWVWHENIRLNVVVIRAIFDYLIRIEMRTSLPDILAMRSGKRTIRDIAKTLGIELSDEDFTDFISIESEVACVVTNITKFKHSMYLRWFLSDRPTLRFFRRSIPVVKHVLVRIQTKIANSI